MSAPQISIPAIPQKSVQMQMQLELRQQQLQRQQRSQIQMSKGAGSSTVQMNSRSVDSLQQTLSAPKQEQQMPLQRQQSQQQQQQQMLLQRQQSQQQQQQMPLQRQQSQQQQQQPQLQQKQINDLDESVDHFDDILEILISGDSDSRIQISKEVMLLLRSPTRAFEQYLLNGVDSYRLYTAVSKMASSLTNLTVT